MVPGSSEQKLLRLACTADGGAGLGLTVTVVLTHEDTPHEVSQRAKYAVVWSGGGIVNGDPVPTGVPPHAPEYQWSVEPAPPTAVSVIVPGSSEQRLFGLDEAEEGGEAPVSTVTVTLSHVKKGLQRGCS
jgi:hypothetical protein